MTNPPDERGAELRELFFETSQELLQALNEESLKLENHPGDEEIVRSIRRTVHTLKGDSAACGLRELSELAHLFEDALTLESAAAHAALAEISFAAADVFAEMLAAYHGGGAMPATENLRQRIKELTAAPEAKKSRRKKKSVAPALSSGKEWTEAEKRALAQAQAAGLGVYDVIVKIDPHCTMPIAARQLIQNAISGIGQVIVVRPDAKSPAASKQVEFVFASAQPQEQIAAKCHIPTIAGDVTVTLIEAAAPAKASATIGQQAVEFAPESAASLPVSVSPASVPPAPAEERTPAPEPGLSQALGENILRVEAGRIDNVLNLVGELIIGKSMLQQALGEFGKRYPKELLRGKFADAMAFQARVLNDLQRSVMKIRMVPVDQLFRRFPRIVRDVARQCGREVDLELSGQETDLDKGILDAIAEPLTHLVRNAVSHGIEPPEERRRMGKSPRGRIRLNALHQGNQVVVEISDDGRGIDAQKIRTKALELGMMTAEEAPRLSEAETLDFIFRPGFSTAEEVTEVSGRGVGMDVVQSVLQRLKATIHVETHVGRGTTFRLKLPLTLAIIKALMFWVEQRLYAIPLNAVSQIARTMESEVHQVDNYEVLQLRNQVLPLLRLGRPSAPDIDRKSSKLFVLVITVLERKYGLIVDALEGEEELVIKALDDQTFATDLVNGASILGDGKVVLILNLPAVVEHVARTRPEAAGMANSGLLLNHADRARMAMSSAGGRA
ncbi:MAG TPA: chemotaxis protein CheA [Candidatus Sulfotelmatobacter sp.]|nr:chemotaxis protein CheA [Terracidiphilus sp.]HTC55154.1 chemotaxis protein CheA [Candidatus Sulfotelmatobacter sp.]